MRVAIAGSSGFVGRALVARLAAQGHALTLLVRPGAREAEATIWPSGQVSIVPVALVGDAPGLARALAGCEALVNLVGAKTQRRASFAAAHVDVVRGLLGACEAAGVRRVVQVSVAGARALPEQPYLASKWDGEEVTRGSGLDWTIVRPGVIDGAGDDFVGNLSAMIRHAGVFPAPGGGAALLAPVAVEDVAEAIAATLVGRETIGQCVDVVGPEALPLRVWVARVATALGLRVWQVAVPVRVLEPVVTMMERLSSAPPLTRAQLGLLAGGVTGDVGQTRALLGREPMALTRARIAALAEGVGPWLGVSLRLMPPPGPALRASWGASAPRLWALVPAAAVLITALRAWTPDIWWCMGLANVVLIPAALRGLRLPWRTLLRPRGWHLAFGAAAAVVLYALGWLGARAIEVAAPQMMGQLSALLGWGALLPVWAALPLLTLIVCGEEMFWRAGVALPVAGRAGPWWGCVASAVVFALAHLGVGPPLLWLAALGCGFAWAWMVVRTRSLIPGIVCHVLWDVTVMFVAPY